MTKTRSDKIRQDYATLHCHNTTLHYTRQDKTRQDKTRQDKTRQNTQAPSKRQERQKTEDKNETVGFLGLDGQNIIFFVCDDLTLVCRFFLFSPHLKQLNLTRKREDSSYMGRGVVLCPQT
jgi:hypothetical protein